MYNFDQLVGGQIKLSFSEGFHILKCYRWLVPEEGKMKFL